MPADNDLDPVDRWLNQQVWPMSPPDGAFERISKRARRRKMRNAAISVGSAVAVVAAVAVAVPIGLSGGLGNSGHGSAPIAASGGSSIAPNSRQSVQGTGTNLPSPSRTAAPSTKPSNTGSASTTFVPSCITTPGCVPDKFIPATVTWVSQTTGYVMGQAGTPGQCGAQGNSDICTSIAVTHDSGLTWKGVPAPVAGAASGLTGVSQLRFLNGVDGWAYGPELYATHDGGLHWKSVPDPFGYNRQVTDLETVNKRAYALWARCTSETECFSYTLMSTPANTDNWVPVDGVPQNLAAVSTPSGSSPGSASFELTGGGSNAPGSGYLIAPDGSLYVGSLPAGGSPSTWQKASHALPCGPPSWLVEGAYGQSLQVLLASYWAKGGTPALAAVCETKAFPQGFSTVVWLSTDNGSTWNEQTNVGKAGVSYIGQALSLTATSDGGLILATNKGIYRLPPGASQWQQATLSAAAPPSGFAYVGMTVNMQGVAIANPGYVSSKPNPNPYGIWMTFDGGQTWQFRAIKAAGS